MLYDLLNFSQILFYIIHYQINATFFKLKVRFCQPAPPPPPRGLEPSIYTGDQNDQPYLLRFFPVINRNIIWFNLLFKHYAVLCSPSSPVLLGHHRACFYFNRHGCHVPQLLPPPARVCPRPGLATQRVPQASHTLALPVEHYLW